MALSPKQSDFVKAFRSKEYTYLMYGGGVGGGKTIIKSPPYRTK